MNQKKKGGGDGQAKGRVQVSIFGNWTFASKQVVQMFRWLVNLPPTCLVSGLVYISWRSLIIKKYKKSTMPPFPEFPKKPKLVTQL